MSNVRILLAAVLAGISVQAQAVGSIVELSVFDRSANVRLPVYWHAGRAWVAGTPGNEYSVRIRNRQGGDVLAVVSVDGVNVVSGATAHPNQSGYVLAPRRTLDIRGWRKSLAETAAFYFTSLGDSYAARTGRPGDVGVIGVAVFRKKVVPPPQRPQPIGRIAPGEKPRRDAAAEDSAGAATRSEAMARHAPSAPLGTGHGRREASHARHVGFQRASSEPAEVITIHYDSRENLLAMGVIREPVHIAPRQPRPFPGFVPDPVTAWPLPAPTHDG
ncbi:MAG: hypothetical protein AB7O31_17195 [Burkholderiales bacterium]